MDPNPEIQRDATGHSALCRSACWLWKITGVLCTRGSARTCSRSCYLPWPRVPGAPSSIALLTDRQNQLSRAQNKPLQTAAHATRSRHWTYLRLRASSSHASSPCSDTHTRLPRAPPRKNTQRGTPHVRGAEVYARAASALCRSSECLRNPARRAHARRRYLEGNLDLNPKP